MATAASPAESRVLLRNISWATFERILAETDRRGTRFTYDRGALEIMSPSREHERCKRYLGRMIESLTEEIGIPISSGGSTTLKSQMLAKGVEPDECYYIANEPRVRGRDELDLAVDPPPDLAIEVDLTSSSLDQLGIYASVGVPEVWLYDGARLRVYHLQPAGQYVQSASSPAFPVLPLDQVERFLSQRDGTDETSWIRSFRGWVKGLSANG
jgi:Uma2 family endonuclease